MDRPTVPLQSVRTDTTGSLQRSSQKHRYFTVVVDDASGHTTALPIVNKSSAGKDVAHKLARLQRQSGRTIQRIHSDGAGELCKANPLRLSNANGIDLTTTVPHTPAMNGVAERAIRTLKESTHTQLISAEVPLKYWQFALLDAAARRNATPHANQTRSPNKLQTFPPHILIHH